MRNDQDRRSDWIDIEDGPCPHRQSDEFSCLFHPIMSRMGPLVCGFHSPQSWRDHCVRFYRMCEIRDIAPNLWGGTEGVDEGGVGISDVATSAR